MRTFLLFASLLFATLTPALPVAAMDFPTDAAKPISPLLMTDSAMLSPPAPLSASLDDLLELPEAMRVAFERQVLDGSRRQSSRFDRLVDFVFAADGMHVIYDASATHTVSQTWITRRANCVGFTLLFLALAREAGLAAQPQEYRKTLTWQQSSGTVFRSSHVNLRVRAGPYRYTVDVARGVVITVDEPVAIDDLRLLAHYHNNIAIGLMANGQIESALSRIEQALRIDPDYPTHWSNAGVIRLRAGDPAGAERAYRHALSLDPEEYGTLFNLVQMLDRQHDVPEVDEFRQRLQAVQLRDPLHQFLLGLSFERAGDYQQAIDHYRDAVRLHETEHRFHAALARAYLANGDRTNAGRALDRARLNSSGAISAAYETQLSALTDD